MADIKRYELRGLRGNFFESDKGDIVLWADVLDLNAAWQKLRDDDKAKHEAAIKAAVAAAYEDAAKIADQGMKASPTTKAKEYAALITKAIRARGAAHE